MDHIKHKDMPVSPGAKGQESRFEVDMDIGMARMMQDMHGLGYTGQPDSMRVRLIWHGWC